MEAPDRSTLSRQALKVLTMFEDGKSPKQISKALGIGSNGVYQHRRRLREKGFEVPESNGTSNGRPAKAIPPAAAAPEGSRLGILVNIQERVSSDCEVIDEALASNRTEAEAARVERDQANARLQELDDEQKALATARDTISSVTLPV